MLQQRDSCAVGRDSHSLRQLHSLLLRVQRIHPASPGKQRLRQTQRRRTARAATTQSRPRVRSSKQCVVLTVASQTPWALCVSEILSVVLIYALACLPAQAHSEQDSTPSVTPAAPPPRHGYHFSYWHSMEDVVGLSCTRAALLSAAYALGMHHMHRCADIQRHAHSRVRRGP